MSLTLNQFLLLVLTLAAVVVSTVVVIFLLQLRRTSRKAEATLDDISHLVKNLNDISQKANEDLAAASELIESSKKIAGGLADISWFASTKLIRPSSKYWPLLFPLVRMGWRQWKKLKRKEEKNG
ncbi:MAG: hypothetical protein B5M54_04335 [Candidatus Aminicenantes bacterium 4484_214]|nr:MAG: hypothetical protein B5M54_04335 [Candidatus Aminicenantes bacterium 4484_214]